MPSTRKAEGPSPVRLFLAPPFLPGKPLVRIIRTHGTYVKGDTLLYKELPRTWDLSYITYVDTPENADAILIPQSIKRRSSEWDAYYAKLRATYGAQKLYIVFLGGDLAQRVHLELPHTACFKGSDYRATKRSNEYMFPGYAEDVGEGRTISIRQKNNKPTVGFCGYAGFPNAKTKIRYLVKNFLLDVLAWVTYNPHYRVYKRGVYFRRKAMTLLLRDSRIETAFIIRDSFGGNATTAKVDPARAREEYIQNMLHSDLVLCPKGDGNYSSRFYEALSLGRIPILIDTDMVLPLEDTLDYSKFILRVPHTDLHRIGDIVDTFWRNVNEQEYEAMQRRARDAFETCLRYDRFFAHSLPAVVRAHTAGLSQGT